MQGNCKAYLGKGRLQHATEDPKLLEIPCFVSEVFNDWKARRRGKLISVWVVLGQVYY